LRITLRSPYAMNDLTPTETLALKIEALQAELQLRDERIFYLVAELAQANAKLGMTDFRTIPLT
jgi:hypothetical protein